MQGKITTFFGNDTSIGMGGKFDQIAKKLELPEIIYPSDVRNDLYIVINSGKIFKEKEKTGNIEMCLEVCDEKGNVINGTIRSGISKIKLATGKVYRQKLLVIKIFFTLHRGCTVTIQY